MSRTGYTGDLGYEIWMPWDAALQVWDAIAAAGRAFDLHPTGMLALDIARIEAGLLLIDVDFHSSRKALIETQKYSPYELGLGRLVDLKKGPFVGRAALAAEVTARASPARSSGSKSTGPKSRSCTRPSACRRPRRPATSRVAVPVYKGRPQVGRATSTTWSTTLKKLIALATIDAPHYAIGHAARNGNDGGSGSSPRRRHRRADAVLQSARKTRSRLILPSIVGGIHRLTPSPVAFRARR